MRVTAVTNRVAVLSGKAANLKQALEAIASEVPKIANVDVAGISVAPIKIAVAPQGGAIPAPGPEVSRHVATGRNSSAKEAREVSLPVCGILTTPYPCLVLRDGRRILEGAPVGDSVVLKIEADSVTLTNDMGRFTWKP